MAYRHGGMLTVFLTPAIVFAGSLSYFAYHVSTEPFFTDEGAYLAQTYYFRLLKQGRVNHVDWLHQASYDHLQFGRLLVGSSLDLHGYELPMSIEGMEHWWDQAAASVDPRRLRAARWPMLIGAAFGCAMMFVLGRLLVGPFTGLLAAGLLAASPVYFTHARRAMADDWVQALLLAAFACSVSLARRITDRPLPYGRCLAAALGAGILFGLAAATKLNGAVGPIALLMVATMTPVAALFLRTNSKPAWTSLSLWFAGVALTLSVAAATFIGIQPYFYARPALPPLQPSSGDPTMLIDGQIRSREWIEKEIRPLADKSIRDRVYHMIRYRQDSLDKVLRENRFPQFSLSTAGQRIWAILNQGIGRWSAASWTHLPPAFAWIPGLLLVILGLSWCVAEGRRQWSIGNIPIAWAFALWPIVETAFLLRDLTLDWDRYYLGVVTWTCLLSAVGIFGTLQQIARRMVLTPPEKFLPTPGTAHAK